MEEKMDDNTIRLCAQKMFVDGIVLQMMSLKGACVKLKGEISDPIIQKSMKNIIQVFKSYLTTDGKKIFNQALKKAIDAFESLPEDMFK